MASVYECRWQHALKWAQRLKELYDTGEYLMESDDQYYEPGTTRICIDQNLRTIDFVEFGSVTNCCIGVFNGNPDFDEGAHDTIEHFTKTVIETVHLYKKIPIII